MSRASPGFSLVEALVALALALVVMSAVVALAANTSHLSQSESRMSDAQQRARAIADTLGRDLRLAGAGVDRGPMTGPLIHAFPPIWPRRIGRSWPDAPSVARDDAIALVYVPDTLVQTTLAASGGGGPGQLFLAPCAGGASACRIQAGATIALFDATGLVDLLGVPVAASSDPVVRPLAVTGRLFGLGATVAEIVIREYYLDAEAAQLRYYDADGTDQPVVDGVSGLSFDYFGDPAPPRALQPPLGVANCLYTDTGAWRGGVTLGSDAEGLAVLPISMFTDGPWCGDGGTAFDADMLRVRRIRVRIRVRSGRPPERQPDYQVVFDAAPPNLGLRPAGGPDAPW